MVNPLPKSFNPKFLFFFLLFSGVAGAQSCVCYQKDMLNDYKDTDFIGVVTVTSKEQHPENPDVDVINFSTQEIFKGNQIEEVYVFQKKGFGKDNTNCRLYLKPGDQLLLYANKKPGFYFTMPCYRNRMLNNTDLAYQETLQNHIKILRELAPFTERLNTTATRCDKIMTDGVTLTTIEDIPVKAEQARMGLYTVKFDKDNSIKRIDVVSSMDKEVDNKVRIALIKKKWQPCNLTENRELLLGYFYTPSTLYRRAHLSPL
jgi:hypothetical protein